MIKYKRQYTLILLLLFGVIGVWLNIILSENYILVPIATNIIGWTIVMKIDKKYGYK